MQNNKQITESKNEVSNDSSSEAKHYLINDEKFQLLKQCQKEVYSATESSPSLRKILNELITEESLKQIKSKFIAVWKF